MTVSKKGFFIAACGFFLMLGVFSGGLTNLIASPQTSAPTLAHNTVPSTPAPKYLLKLHGETLAVFDPDTPTVPTRLTEIHAASLRHYDREQLRVGVLVFDEEELLMLLEDYGS